MSAFNRRDFFKGLGASALFLSSPEKILMGSILDGIFNKAQATSTGVEEKNLINIFFDGGPPRWYFDLPLRPNGNDVIVENAMAKNKFVLTNGVMKAVVDTHQVGDFYLPYLWKSNIPTSNGGFVPMANLAQSAVFIRGYNLVNDGHSQNRIKHNSPVPGTPSLSGIFADHSSKPFSAVTSTESHQHNSGKGKSIINVPLDGNPFSSMMAPFNLSNPRSFNRRQAMDDAIKTLHSNVSSFFGSQNPYANSLIGERDSSIELFIKGTSGLQGKYNVLFNKYRSLEMRAYSENPLAGLDDQEIIIQQDTKYNIGTGFGDLTPNTSGGDLRTIMSANSKAEKMAENFAIAEYIITEGLSSSIMVAIDFISGINLSNFNYKITSSSASVTGLTTFGFDSHETGSHTSLYIYSKLYKAFAACLYEFISVLKANNIYNNSIIQLSSEFNRAARTAGHGSDHGWNGSGTSLYSGMFDNGTGPLVIGNVDNNINGGGYAGTWGLGAPVPEMNNRIINIGNIMSTVTGLAGYETPTKNDSPLLKMVDGQLVNLAGVPRNV